MHRTRWDPLNIEYPVNKLFETGRSSVALAYSYRGHPEVLTAPRRLQEELSYSRDCTTDCDRLTSQSTVDYKYKLPENVRFNKHTSCLENLYINHPSKRFSARVPASTVHGTTETRARYRLPRAPPAAVSEHYRSQLGTCGIYDEDVPMDYPHSKDMETIDTTEESFLIHLDPYVTTSRQYHRPFTADQLARPSNTRDIITYHALSQDPWVRSPKPPAPEFRPHTSKPMVDRETFQQDTREVRTHNKMTWVSGSFRTEVRDNFMNRRPIPNKEHFVRTKYHRAIANMATDVEEMMSSVKNKYFTESMHTGSGKPLASVLDPFVEKNERLKKKIFS